MAYIIINETTFDVILMFNPSENTNYTESGFINSPIEIQDIWSREASKLSYILKLSDNELWILIQYLLAHNVVTLYDSKTNINISVWIDSIDEDWNDNDFDKPWKITLSLTKLDSD